MKYSPGKYMYIADYLSRVYLENTIDNHDRYLDIGVHSVVSNFPIANENKNNF